jgi:ribosomal-protein-alanine N-acetyltransferase
VRAPTLRTARLELRPYEERDADALYRYRSDPEWGRFVTLPHPYTREQAALDAREYATLDASTHAYWAIVRESEVVGNIDAELEQPRRALAGWGIARWLWGRGLTTEAASAVLDWSFERWDIERWYANASASNIGSWRVMEKLGMRREATLRLHREDRERAGAAGNPRGVPADEVWYGILRGEWEIRRR